MRDYHTAMADSLLVHARLATMREARASVVEDGAMHIAGGRIAWVGATRDVPPELRTLPTHDTKGALVTPGLVDCHTHLVFAGTRAADFERRLAGATYEEIARAGGGILSTVRATRLASDADLHAQAARRLEALASEGVTAVEIKSGYALDVEGELRLLRIARGLQDARIRVCTTLLAAHAVPPEFTGRGDDYVDAICGEMIPRAVAEGLVDAVDAFCERIAFTAAQTRRVFACAAGHGLRLKLHADQLSDGDGAALAAEFEALSADHLEHASEAGIAAMARAGTVAVLLPVPFYFLQETRKPSVEALRRHGVPMAVASDCNPGTAPCASLLTAMNMACTLFGLTPEEALVGATAHAARALGCNDRGQLEPGCAGDYVVWDAESPAELAWMVAGRKPRAVVTAQRTL
jgi:imidazolonepropionase